MRRMLRLAPAVLVLGVVLVIGLTGCSKQLPQQVTDVNRGLSSAKDACASVYAEQELQAVEKQAQSMNDLADDGKYRKARKAAEPLLSQVEGLSGTATTARDQAKSEAEAAMAASSAPFDAARGAEAGTYASKEFAAAEAKLAQARSAMNDPCRYREAGALAAEASKMAAAAGDAAVAEKERVERERKLAEEKRKREEEARRLKEEEEKKRKMFPSSYTVARGDSLWSITGMERVYGNPVFWPVLHDANGGAISDPNLIYPGQELQIPRGMTEPQMTEKLHDLWGRYLQED